MSQQQTVSGRDRSLGRARHPGRQPSSPRIVSTLPRRREVVELQDVLDRRGAVRPAGDHHPLPASGSPAPRSPTVRCVRFSIFVKVVQSWALSPAFQFVPPEFRGWRSRRCPGRWNRAAYESALAAALPPGLRMPQAYAVRGWTTDPRRSGSRTSTSTTSPGRHEHFRRAARLLGRFAASPAVRAAVAPLGRWISPPDRPGVCRRPGRDAMVIPALRGDERLVAPAGRRQLRPELRRRTLQLVDAAAGTARRTGSAPERGLPWRRLHPQPADEQIAPATW